MDSGAFLCCVVNNVGPEFSGLLEIQQIRSVQSVSIGLFNLNYTAQYKVQSTAHCYVQYKELGAKSWPSLQRQACQGAPEGSAHCGAVWSCKVV